MASLEDTITESVLAIEDMRGVIPTYEEIYDTFWALEMLRYSDAFPVFLTDDVEFSETLTQVLGKHVRERVQVTDTMATTTRYGLALVEGSQFRDTLIAGYPVTVLEAVETSDQLTVLLGAVIAEQLQLAEAWAPNGIYSRTITQMVRLSDALVRMANLSVSETIEIAGDPLAKLRAKAQISDTVEIADTFATHFVLSAVASDTIELSATSLVNMLFYGQVAEGVEISGGIFSPDGAFTAWAMNTRTGGVTEYENFGFNSFAQVGGRYIGASEAGLFELNGEDDDGDDIVARIRGGYMQFGGTHHSRLKAAYLAVRGAGDFILKIETAEGATYNYAASAQSMHTTKVYMGKGQRARYFAFELISAGQDFDLESLEFVPIVVQRRV